MTFLQLHKPISHTIDTEEDYTEKNANAHYINSVENIAAKTQFILIYLYIAD